MISDEFDDIYFSKEDGLSETRHVFLAGNNLPEAWHGRERFCICETGFGTGLNILAAWKLFEDTAKPEQRLDFISIEKFPLAVLQIREALEPWRQELGVYLDRLLAIYPMRVRGFHRIDLSERVSLTLVFDDVRRALPEIEACVDAWFLDGFAPAKNPDMWESVLYEQMARLSARGASYASFTAAGDVRRGLAASGFSVEKQKGFGRKRDMIAGRYEGAGREPMKPQKSVAVIGAGVAGLSAAWHLRRAGCDVKVYEAAPSIATKASGNICGVVNPKLTAQRSAQSDYYTAAFAYARRFLKAMQDIDYAPHGGLHLQLNEDKERRFNGYVENLGWYPTHISILDAASASDVAGIGVSMPCLYYPDAASLSPLKLCQALARDVQIETGVCIERLEQIDADAIVVANAADVRTFIDVPVGRVRGQVTQLVPNDVSRKLKTNLSYGGYLTPPMASGLHMCGATFQPWGTSDEVLEEDHGHNIRSLMAAVPSIGHDLAAQGGWTAFRASARDRLPLIGCYGDVYLSCGHGSHGVISGLMAGAYIAQSLCGGPLPLGAEALACIDPKRFHKG
ncbi:MAG: FAD-dependent oxidoreductase [Proteobacteria bacterium]|nr:FAD-dependent oxidoreductase [Pseudomonadota bacterium]